MENDFYGNHEFNIEKPESFIRKKSSARDSIYSKSDQYWSKTVTKVWVKWIGVYKMLDTLQTVKKFKQITSFVTVLGISMLGTLIMALFFPVLVIMKWRAFA
jgi:hypothetical protein